MPKYILKVETTLTGHDDGVDRGSLSREYLVEDLGEIAKHMDHAARSAALHFEGVEKLDMDPEVI